MPDLVPQAELLRALGRVARGLSCLFWGLPLMLVICVRTAATPILDVVLFDQFPPILISLLLLFGLFELGRFQPQERVWHRALDRAKLIAFLNLGLSPFLYWWLKFPGVPYFIWAVGALGMSGLLFLALLNRVLRRLAAMLPDETLRQETRVFTSLNLLFLVLLPTGLLAYLGLSRMAELPTLAILFLTFLNMTGQWFLLFFILLPVAMTMALIWKTKEIVLAGVYEAAR